MKYELSKTEGQKKSKSYLQLSIKYKKKYLHNKEKNYLTLSLSNKGFYYHSKAILAGTSHKHKLNYYNLAAKTFRNLNQISPSNTFHAYENWYNGYICVVRAGTSLNNRDKSVQYKTASTYFTNASKLFKNDNHIEDSTLCKGWTYLTQSCMYNSKAASESKETKRIKLYKHTLQKSKAAQKIFKKLKINKLQKRSKSLEFSSKGWIFALKKENFKQASILFHKSSIQINGINEWHSLNIFCSGLSKLFKGISTQNNAQAKTTLLAAEKLFRNCGCINLAVHSSNLAKKR